MEENSCNKCKNASFCFAFRTIQNILCEPPLSLNEDPAIQMKLSRVIAEKCIGFENQK